MAVQGGLGPIMAAAALALTAQVERRLGYFPRAPGTRIGMGTEYSMRVRPFSTP